MAAADKLEAAGVKIFSLKDIRSFGQFSGMEGDWSSWSFAFDAATGSIGWGSAITSSVTHDTDISFTALSRVNQSIANNLYTLLAPAKRKLRPSSSLVLKQTDSKQFGGCTRSTDLEEMRALTAF